MSRKSVHVLTVINSASNITTEVIDGDEHIIVRDIVPIVDDIVMNGGLYPAAEINKSYKSLEGKAMPFGHPKVDGKYVSANNPRAINQFNVGAWSKNVRKDGDKVKMDMYVNKRVANASKHGPEVVAALEALKDGTSTDPIHVSTGLDTMKGDGTGTSKGKKYRWIANDQVFDHTAILLHEQGAGTPTDGVGIFVNAEGGEMDVETVNLADASDCRRDGLMNKIKFYMTNDDGMSFDEIASSLREAIRIPNGDSWRYIVSVYPDSFIYEEEKKGTPGQSLFKQKYLISDRAVTLVGEPQEVVRKPTEYEIKTNGEDNPMKQLIINALQAKGKPTEGKTEAELMDAYNAMVAEDAKAAETPEEKAARLKKVADAKVEKDTAANNDQAPAWFQPFADKLNTIESGLTANADKEKVEKRQAVKLALNMSDEEVADLDGKALDRLYANSQKSFGLSGAFRHNNEAESISTMPE